jgi:hypothetical protein
MQKENFYSCQAINCIRNLPIKTQVPISAFSIERTCFYAKENSCRVKAENSQYFTPTSNIKANLEKCVHVSNMSTPQTVVI